MNRLKIFEATLITMLGIFLDIETTGLSPFLHKPVEIAIKIVDLSIGHYLGEYQAIVKYPEEIWEQRDRESIEVNGFSWEKVCSGVDPETVKTKIIELFQECAIERGEAMFICQNPSFDRAFFNQLIDAYTQENLNWPYHWLDLASMYWCAVNKAKGKDLEKISLSKNAIARAYNLPTEERPHMAMNGVDHLIECYQAVMNVKFAPLKNKGST